MHTAGSESVFMVNENRRKSQSTLRRTGARSLRRGRSGVSILRESIPPGESTLSRLAQGQLGFSAIFIDHKDCYDTRSRRPVFSRSLDTFSANSQTLHLPMHIPIFDGFEQHLKHIQETGSPRENYGCKMVGIMLVRIVRLVVRLVTH